MPNLTALIVVATVMFCVLGGVTLLAHIYNLNNIKSKTVGDGQHGTARFSTKAEIRKVYRQVPFTPEKWRRQAKQNALPKLPQGIIVGCQNKGGETVALVDDADVHCMMVGAAGCGKTAYWLYPNLEYACASGMSFLTTDTKGDLYRNYGAIAEEYGYQVAVIDLRNPTKSDGNNLLHLVNKYMDLHKEDPGEVAYRAKAEKYAKIIAKTLIYGDGDASAYGQNAFFYDSAEGLLTAVILLIAEFAQPEERHIVSVFKLIQELMAPSGVKGKNQFQLLMDRLPPDHKARWFSGAALSTGDQAMASIMSTAMSRLNAFLDSEMEQVLCFDTAIDAERFCHEKSAIFLVLPEENPNATLRVFRIYGDTNAAESLMFQTEQGWNFFPDKRGNLYGEKDGMVMNVSFYEAEVETFVVIRTYPQEAYEGWGRMLSVLEDTFSAWPTEIRTKYPLG